MLALLHVPSLLSLPPLLCHPLPSLERGTSESVFSTGMIKGEGLLSPHLVQELLCEPRSVAEESASAGAPSDGLIRVLPLQTFFPPAHHTQFP